MRQSTRSLSQPEPVAPMKLKIAIEASRLAASDLRDAVVDAGRNEVRADQPVGRGAADEERAGQQIEVAVRRPTRSAANAARTGLPVGRVCGLGVRRLAVGA